MITNAKDIRFRCSSLGYLMTDPRSKSETISETTKTHLVDVYVSAAWGRREEAHSKHIDKGNDREEDSITLLSVITGTFYKKNETELSNDYIKGTPDVFTGESIRTAKTIIDTKTSWSANTFFRTKVSGLDKKYWWQVQGYMALTGATEGAVVHCLVNSTASLILDEKRKAGFRYGPDPESDPDYIEECQQIERNHIFDMAAFREENPHFDFHTKEWCYDIPAYQRIIVFNVQRDDEQIQRLYQRIKDCREYMNRELFQLIAA